MNHLPDALRRYDAARRSGDPLALAAAARALAGTLLFVLSDLRRQDPEAAEAERLCAMARLDPAENDAARTKGEHDAIRQG